MSFRKFGTRIGAGFGLVLILLCAIIFVGIQSTSFLNAKVNIAATLSVQRLHYVYALIRDYDLFAGSLHNIVLANDEGIVLNQKVDYERARTSLLQSLDEIAGTAEISGVGDAASSIRDALFSVIGLSDKALNLILNQKREQATSLINHEVFTSQARLIAALDSLAQLQLDSCKADAKTCGHAAESSKFLLLAFGIGAVLLGILSAKLLALKASVWNALTVKQEEDFSTEAEAVRNFALRSVEETQATANLFERAVNLGSGGSELISATDGQSDDAAANCCKVCEPVSEKSSTPQADSHDLGQVACAVKNIEKTAQQNVGSA